MEALESLLCEVCGNVFSSLQVLYRHQRTAKYCVSSIDKEYKCICEYKTSLKQNYERHIIICPPRKTINELNVKLLNSSAELQLVEEDIVLLEDEISDLKTKLASSQAINVENKEAIKKFKVEIAALKLQIANDKGQITVYEKRPGTTNVNNYVNPKLVNIKCDTIRPFTIETVKEEIDNGSYTYDHFLKGASGLANFIAEMTTQDDQRSYVCTDSARNKFHRLLESRKWKDDNGATFLTNVLNELLIPAESYYTRIVHMTGDNISDEDRDFADVLMQRTKPLYFAIKDKKSTQRSELLNKVRLEVKKLAAI